MPAATADVSTATTTVEAATAATVKTATTTSAVSTTAVLRKGGTWNADKRYRQKTCKKIF